MNNLQKARQLSQALKKIAPSSPKPVVRAPVKVKNLDFILKYRPKKEKLIRSPYKVASKSTLIIQKGKDGLDGKDANEESIIQRVFEMIKAEFPTDEKAFMERFLERIQKEKLIDVSHLRNAESFIYGGTKYKISELMHGGSSGSAGTVYYTPTGTIDSVNTTFGVTAQPTSVISDGTTYFEGYGYSYSALVITMDIPPSQFIKYTL